MIKIIMEIQHFIQVNDKNIIFIEKIHLITTTLLASEKGNTEIVKYLVSEGSNINHTNKYGNTALHSG